MRSIQLSYGDTGLYYNTAFRGKNQVEHTGEMVYAIKGMKYSCGIALPRAEELMKKAKWKNPFRRPAGKHRGLQTPTQLICVSFVIVIALGTFLLSLPIASRHGKIGRAHV